MFLEIYSFVTQTVDGIDTAVLIREAVCDIFSSLIWDVEYYECGQFEICVPAEPETMNVFQKGRIVGRSDDSDNFGIIEKIHLETGSEDGNFLTVSGRFLMSLLNRRIIYPTISVTSQTGYGEIVMTAVRNNCVKGYVDSDSRIIPSLVVGDINGDCWDKKTTLQISYTNLMAWVYDICETTGGTANIRLAPYTDDIMDMRRKLIFELSQGTDRSYSQDNVPAVIFSDGYDNLSDFTHETDSSSQTNVAYAFGQGEGSERKRTIYYAAQSEPQCLERYELYVDADDISTEQENENGEVGTITDDAYIALLEERGAEKLTDEVTTDEASIAANETQFVYGRDYFVGDYITLQNNYFQLEIEKTQLVGMIESFDNNGHTLYPTLKKREE